MEINVGDYVRTDEIGKVVYLYDDGSIEIDNSKESFLIYKCNIIKHSKDIINLIEVGDYVNGHKVCMDLKDSKKNYNSKSDFITCKDYTFENDEIETVLTHEQFESNAYFLEKEV